LRERLDDLDELVPAIVAEYDARSGKTVRVIPDPVWTALKAYDWPGNVRELRNVIERCVLFADGETFPLQWLQFPGGKAAAPAPPAADGAGDRLTLPLDGTMSLDDMDRHIVAAAVSRAEGNLSAAARMLGTTRQTLRYRVKKYGIQTGDAD
jgi:DNA-binding NtrC family response regulator